MTTLPVPGDVKWLCVASAIVHRENKERNRPLPKAVGFAIDPGVAEIDRTRIVFLLHRRYIRRRSRLDGLVRGCTNENHYRSVRLRLDLRYGSRHTQFAQK